MLRMTNPHQDGKRGSEKRNRPLRVRTRKSLTKKDVFERVVAITHVLLANILGDSSPIKEVAKVIANVAGARSTVNAVARRNRKGPKAPAIRYHSRKLKGKGSIIEKYANKLLIEQARKVLKKGVRYEFVIDNNDKETYIKTEHKYIVKSKAKNGTNKFVSHATLYAIVRKKRVTLSFVRVVKGMPRVTIIEEFVSVLQNEGYSIKRLYLDRGFYSVAIIQFLKSNNINTILAMPLRGEKKGLKSRLHGKRSHWIMNHVARTTTMGKANAVMHPVAAIATYQKGRRKKNGVRWYVYAVIGDRLSLPRIRQVYRGRFGIETSYRIKNQALGWTTSPLPEIRTLYFAVSLLLQNEWVCVNWFYFRERRRGRPSGKPLFPFQDFLELLLEGCKAALGGFDRVRILEWRDGGPFGYDGGDTLRR
jgi:putative transposase